MPTGHRTILLRSVLLLTKLIGLSRAVTVDTESTGDMATVLWKALLSTAEQLLTHDSEEGCPNADVCHPPCRDLGDNTTSFAVHLSIRHKVHQSSNDSAEESQGGASANKYHNCVKASQRSLHVSEEVSQQALNNPAQSTRKFTKLSFSLHV